MDWQTAALEEIRGLKPHWVKRYSWAPRFEVRRTDENNAKTPIAVIDLFVELRGRRFGKAVYVLRLRYLPDWQTAGRRESFVNPEDPSQDGIEFWPPHETVRGVKTNHSTPAICLRGVWGYHSVLHPAERPDGTTLLGFLIELQKVIDE